MPTLWGHTFEKSVTPAEIANCGLRRLCCDTMSIAHSSTDQKSADTPLYLTAAQLQRRWGVSDMFLLRARREGRIRVHKFGPGAVRYALSDVEKFEKEAAA